MRYDGCTKLDVKASFPALSQWWRTNSTMTIKCPIRILALFLLFLRVEAPAQQPAPDLTGIWSGTFISRNSDISPFTITVKINKNSRGHFVGDASLVSDCLDSPRLEVTVNGSNVVLEGSDAQGDTVSFRGPWTTRAHC